jgi:hypothetical protein
MFHGLNLMPQAEDFNATNRQFSFIILTSFDPFALIPKADFKAIH